MSTRRGYIAAIAVFAMVMIALVPAFTEDSSADASNLKFGNQKGHSDNMKGGYLSFEVDNPDNSTVYIDVIVKDGSKVIKTETGIKIPGKTSTTVEISLPDYKDVGKHNLTVICENSENGQEIRSFNVSIEVDKNVLSNPATYILIIILVIVIVALAYMKLRDSPKKEQTMTFEELEEQRKADMAVKSEKKKKDSAPKTERQRYLDSKKKQ